MKAFQLHIQCENDAFDGEYGPSREVARILRKAADRFENLGIGIEGKLRDCNGNTVGVWKYED